MSASPFKIIGAVVMASALLAAAPAHAVLLKATSGDFLPSDRLIDFEGLTHGEPINTQFSSLGATFSDGYFGSTLPGHVGAFAESGNVIGINFDPLLIGTGSPLGFTFGVDITFSSPITRFGMDVVSSPIVSMTLAAFNSSLGLPTGTQQFNTFQNEIFAGITSDTPFTILRIQSTSSPNNGGLFFNNLRFDGAATIAVSAPGGWGLFLVGVLGLFGLRQRGLTG